VDLDAVTYRVSVPPATVLPSGKAESLIVIKRCAEVADLLGFGIPQPGTSERSGLLALRLSCSSTRGPPAAPPPNLPPQVAVHPPGPSSPLSDWATTGLGSEHSESWSHVDEPRGVARSPHILTRKIIQMALRAPLALGG